MEMSGISQGTLGLIFIKIYDSPSHYFVNFSKVARKKILRIVFTRLQWYILAVIFSSTVFTLLNQIQEN